MRAMASRPPSEMKFEWDGMGLWCSSCPALREVACVSFGYSLFRVHAEGAFSGI